MQPKLLILTPGFPSNQTDTLPVPHIQDFIQAIKPFFQLKIISFQYPFEEKKYLWQEIEIYSAGGKNKPFPLRLLTWHKILKQIQAWHTAENFELILCFWLTECALIGEHFCQKNPQIKLIKWSLGQDAKPDNLYLRLLHEKQGKTLCLSHRNAQMIGNNIQILPFGLSNHWKNIPITQERKIDIIGIGSHISLKRYDVFLHAVAMLKKDFPQLNCMLIGEGKDCPKLKNLAKQLHIEENVCFRATLSREKVFEQLADSKILFHPSEYEGQGMVLMEALQMGCYVVCGEIGYVPATEKAFICAKDADFLPKLKTLLTQEMLDFSAINMPTMQETAQQFRASVAAIF